MPVGTDTLFGVLERALSEKLEHAGTPEVFEKARAFLWQKNAESLHDLLSSLSGVADHIAKDVENTLENFIRLYDGKESQILHILQKGLEEYQRKQKLVATSA